MSSSDETGTPPPLAPGLYLVATPIGNLEDISLRALRILRSVDRIACEDTRQTQKLLHHFSIAAPTVSYHLHNERSRADELVAGLLRGDRIAIVSDAGMPGIADPGGTVVAAAIAAQVPVFAIPGANAALSALIVSGLDAERFTFNGFLPSKSGERRSALEAVRGSILQGGTGTQIFYETPHRILDALQDVQAVFGPQHSIALSRELTKLHEETLRGTVAEVRAVVEARPALRGEMVLLLSGDSAGLAPEAMTPTFAAAVQALMQAENLSEKDALKQAGKTRGLGKSESYREWQRTRTR